MAPRPDPPTPEDEREFEFEQGLKREQERFFKAVHDAKPYVDYVAMLTIHAALAALFGVIMVRTFTYETFSERGFFGAVICIILWWRLVNFNVITGDALASILLIKIAQRLKLDYPFTASRSAAMRFLFTSWSTVFTFAILLGTGFIGYEFARRTVASMANPIETASTTARERTAKETEPTSPIPVPIFPGFSK